MTSTPLKNQGGLITTIEDIVDQVGVEEYWVMVRVFSKHDINQIFP
jgi:hypothetical protein